MSGEHCEAIRDAQLARLRAAGELASANTRLARARATVSDPVWIARRVAQAHDAERRLEAATRALECAYRRMYAAQREALLGA